MRLASIEPRRPDRNDGFEHHVYRCDSCANVSRFVFETPAPTGRMIAARG